MSTLYIAEVEKLGIDAMGASVIAPEMPPLAEQTIAITSGTLPSAPFGGRTRFVQIHCDAVCSVAWGQNPQATTSNMRLGAGDTRYYGVTPGDQLAVIQNV